MSAGLIKHLRKKTDEDSNTKILMSQWEFDEKLVGKSLENVGSYYPHFSSHNESHSQQILVNIERLLGSNIDKLTATDTWLILEAAYWHDIGMLFNADEVQDVVKNEKFKDYVEELANNNVQDLHEFAKVWHDDGWEAALVHYDNPYTGVEKYRQMVAEWYRRDHPANSERVILKPFEKLNISSPRTELLPNRIYRYLAQICLSHGKSFNYVMKDLPFRQTGMGTEDCHPRFVACLLRLGDLFDIDDNRFCPVMARQVGNMPSFSETHKHKHQAIREFQLDNETVSVTAICSTEMAYIECRNWFDWIKEEIQNQMSQWKNIVPSRDFGLLPTINKLDVEMTDKKILLNDKPMKFSLDERSAIELLQGNNLYKDDMSIYRELIQNAIDATMIRVWLEHGQEQSIRKLTENANPYDAETRELFADYPITLDYRKVADNKDSTTWELSIEDNGIGISRKDLEYMQKIAGSKNNKEKQKIVRQMPQWMQPSGEFGIGLHSAFLLMKDLPSEQQKINIFTKSRLTHESLKIELNSPLSGKAGYCFIEEISDLGKYGTKLTVLEVHTNNLSTNISVGKGLQLQESIRDYIIFDYGIGSIEVFKKILYIRKNISNPLVLTNVSKRIAKPLQNVELFNQYYNIEPEKSYWSKYNNSSLRINILGYEDIFDDEGTEKSLPMDNIMIYYKGQFIESLRIDAKATLDINNLSYRFIVYKLDIYSDKASLFLNLSRDKIRNKNKILLLLNEVFNELKLDIERKKFDLSLIIEKPTYRSLFENLLIENFSSKLEASERWKNYRITKNLTINELFELKSFTIGWEQESITDLGEINEIDLSHIKSKLLTELASTSLLKKELLIKDFSEYYLKSKKNHSNRILGDVLYSRIEIKNNKIDKGRNNNSPIPASKEAFNSFFSTHISLLYIGIDNLLFYLDLKKAGQLIFSEKNTLTYSELMFSFEDITYFIFPYIGNDKEVLIEISNEKLYKILEHKISIDIEIFNMLYDSFKEYIVKESKETCFEWYEAYQRGKNFQPIDLTFLDKLYKPTT